MFNVELSEYRKVVLVRFSGDLSEADIAGLETLRASSRTRGPYDIIFDFTAVEQTVLTTDLIAARGAIPQTYPDRKRIYVAPSDD